MRWIAVAGVSVGLLAGCGQAEQGASTEAAVTDLAAPPPPAASAPAEADAASSAEPAAPSQTQPAQQTGTPVGLPMLAYKYGYQLELPARGVAGMLSRHEAQCAAAGPRVCQVIAVERSAAGRDEITARLEMRAEPRWLARFRAGLEEQAEDAGGRLAGSNTETEDLTRSIIDTDARLRAHVALRDRLLRLLAERPGKLADVLEVERELARVQGEIDSGTSQLSAMRARVATSALEIRYETRGAAVTDGTFAPLADAGDSFVRNMVLAFAGLLTLLSFLLPIGLVVGAVVWAVLAWRRRRRARKAKVASV